jgi:type IV pilus assembly protein PilA
MLNKLRVRVQGESGFTLVELLVVMLILGLLAAIAIPSFFNQRDKAKDADAKAHARTAQTAIETYATDNHGSYADATPTLLKGIETTLNDSINLQVSGLGEKTYTVTVGSEVGGQTFSINRDADGVLDSECTVHNKGGCPSDGNWAADGPEPAPAP